MLASVTQATMVLAEDLGTPVSREQAIRIAANSLYPGVVTIPTPLTPEERAVAEQLHYHSQKALLAEHPAAAGIPDAKLREWARERVEGGEREHRTPMTIRIGEKAGCLVMLGFVGACSMIGAAVLVGLVIVRGY